MNKLSSEFNEALDCHRRGDLSAAARKYRKILKKFPDHFDTLHHLGMIWSADGQFDRAEELFRQCIRLDPKFSPIYNSLSDTLISKGDFESAISCCEQAIKLSPNNLNSYMLIARAYSGLGQLDRALATYNKILFFNPRAYQALNNSGNIYLLRGEFERAIAAFNKAIETEPSFEIAYFNRSTSYLRLGNFESAVIDMEYLVNVSKNNATYWKALANLYERLIRFNDALAAARTAYQLAPKDHESIAIIAKAYANSGYITEAQMLFAEILDQDPKNSGAWLVYGYTLKEIGNLHGAATAFERAKIVKANYFDAEFNLSCLDLLQGDLLRGFERFEARKKQFNAVGMQDYGVPEWLGQEDLNGKTILVHEEQ